MYNTTQDLVKRLPDVFKKEDSNIYKLLQIIGEESDQIKLAYEDIKKIKDIDQAQGVNLDNIGKNLNLRRTWEPDEVYRLLLKFKITAKLKNNFNTLIEIISTALNINKEEVYLVNEKEFFVSDGESASLILGLPSPPIDNLGIEYQLFMELLQQIIPAGVILKLLKQFPADLVETFFDRWDSEKLKVCGTLKSENITYTCTEGRSFTTDIIVNTKTYETDEFKKASTELAINNSDGIRYDTTLLSGVFLYLTDNFKSCGTINASEEVTL